MQTLAERRAKRPDTEFDGVGVDSDSDGGTTAAEPARGRGRGRASRGRASSRARGRGGRRGRGQRESIPLSPAAPPLEMTGGASTSSVRVIVIFLTLIRTEAAHVFKMLAFLI